MAINCQSSIIETDENHRSVEFTVSFSEMDKLFEKNINEFRKQVAMKGFRPGQVPKQLFVSRFGDEVYRETVDRVVNNDLKNEFEKLVEKWKTEEKLEIAAPAEHRELQAERGQDLTYKLTVALNKPLVLQGYKELGIKAPDNIVVAEKEIDDAILKLRKKYAKDIPVNRPAKFGDVVKGNYLKRVVDGKEIAIPEDPRFEFELDEEIALKFKDLNKALMGVSAGEEKEFTENFEGKTTDYKLQITEICELELQKDEEFYSIINAENETALKERITNDILKKKQQDAHNIALEEAYDKLIAKNPFPVLEEQIKYTAEKHLQQYYRRYMNEDNEEEITVSEAQLNSMRPDISRTIQRDRILHAIIEQESLKPTQSQVDARIQEIADSVKMDFASVKETMRKSGQVHNLRENLKLEMAENLLIGKSLPEKPQESV